MKYFIENGKKPQICVLGGGSWATAIVKLLTDNGHNLSWYMRNNYNIAHIRKYGRNQRYLPAAKLDVSRFVMSDDINAVAKDADILIFAVPSAYFISEVSKIRCSLQGKFLISAVKGFVGNDHLTVAEYFNHNYGVPFDKIGVISGPCHAEEIALERLSYLTITAKSLDVSEYLCSFFQGEYVNAVTGTDIYGVEHAAALKNVYALAAGICHGLGYGDNYQAVLVTCAFHELKYFINISHPDKDRLTTTSAYLGDLLVTSYSQFSRNRTFGAMIGKGYSVVSAQMEMGQVAEGYFAAKAIHEINQSVGADMPIAEAVYNILYNGHNAEEEILLLNKKLK